MSPLQDIEQAIRHPGDFVSFPPLPGESQSSHRIRMQAHATHKVFRAHNPVLPLPTEQLAAKAITRQTTMKLEQPQSPEGETSEILQLLRSFDSRLKAIEDGSKRTRIGGVSPRKKLKGKKGIGGLIESLRAENGWNQTVFGQKCGVHHANISNIERKDNADLGLGTLTKIAKGFGLTVSELLAKAEARDAVQPQE